MKKEVLVETSARHVHVSREALDILFGEGYELTKKQEDAGLIGTMELLDVERNLLQSEMNLATARQNELVALIDLAKALGGGWDEKCGFGPYEQRVQEEKEAFDAARAQAAQNAQTQPSAQAEQPAAETK